MKPTNPSPLDPAPRGFALIVTLSLMMLLTVIAVGLLSLSAVSLRTSSQGQAAAAARANARLALMMAIGELQKEMGPDSRISAPHDAGSTPTGGQPRWTAVYDAWKRPADPATAETPADRTLKFRGWLVSGANQAMGGPPGTGEIAKLVSTKSLPVGATAADEILAPMHAVTSGNQRGSIAWWTADEGAKAKINAGADASATGAVASNPLFDAQSPPHVGHKAIKALEAFDWKPGQRSIAITNGVVNLAADLGNRGVGNLNHDITVHSAGVLSDVRAGSLRRDLTNLLTRPIAELESKPLYLADGRMNRFQITENGAVENASPWPAFTSTGADYWGINLEELHLFHQLYREVEWDGSVPKLVSKSNSNEMANDRFFLYRNLTLDGVQFMYSLQSVLNGSTGKYDMRMMIDGMCALKNPYDVAFENQKGLAYSFYTRRLLYKLTWDIKRGGSTINSQNSIQENNFNTFTGYIEGLNPAFTLQPGELAVFGSSTGSGYNVNVRRGFVPSGGVRMTNWDLKATGLEADDTVDFRLNRETGPLYGANGSWGYYASRRASTQGITKISDLDNAAANSKFMYSVGLLERPPANAFVDQMLAPLIEPPEVLKVSAFTTPKPVLITNNLRNVEQDSAPSGPDAFPSRPYLSGSPYMGDNGLSKFSTWKPDRIANQTLITVEPMNYQYRTIAAGAGGANAYHGGGRQKNLGGSFNVITRRVPLAAPLSLGAFENAIAAGHNRRFGGGTALSGTPVPPPYATKVIGNSYSSPFLAAGEVYRTPTDTDGGTDHSWMINNALWDSWFLSGIVDGTGLGSNPLQTDSRTQRAQFNDLAKGTGTLRNSRFLFHPHRSPDDALDELFDGDTLKYAALNNLTKYLLVDGAFNVNSTSQAAWKALLSSVRDQELIVNGGAKQKFDYPYGTLGYAANTSSDPLKPWTKKDDWTGLRDLSELEIDALASAIVVEVKARGPFLSMADFVNRRPDGRPEHQALGALQAAIDKAGLNARFTTTGRTVTASDFSPLPGGGISAEPAPARSAGAAGHLTQARLLTALGPQIAVRSDTFIIRTYGDARDSSGKILARAWCEAVVQRVPEYVDPSDRPEAHDGWPQPANKLSTANSRFGRRFEIESFRWLDSKETVGS